MMIKKITSLFCLVILLLVFSTFSPLTLAQNIDNSQSRAASEASKINIFELFWPLTAGKTMDDSLYFLKILKENVREMLIFGSTEKANYDVMIATKRLLEANALIAKKNNNLAEKTMDVVNSKLKEASINFENAKKSGSAGNYSDSIVRLQNMREFIDYISAQETDIQLKDKLKSVSFESDSLQKMMSH